MAVMEVTVYLSKEELLKVSAAHAVVPEPSIDRRQ